MRVWDIAERDINFGREHNRRRRSSKLAAPADNGKTYNPMLRLNAARELRRGSAR